MQVPEALILIHFSPQVLASAGLDETTLWRELPELDADHAMRVRPETTPAHIAQALTQGLERAREQSDFEEDRRRSRTEEEASLTAELLQELNRETNDAIEDPHPTQELSEPKPT